MDKSLNQYTYNLLKKDILSFTLKPGEAVSAAKLADRYFVSRTPAREALVKLETEGMVNIYPQSKTIISKLNSKRIHQEWFLRKTLELGMVDPFFENVKHQDVEMMRIHNNTLKMMITQPISPEMNYEFMSCDIEFHTVTYKRSGELLSARLIQLSTAHYNRLRMLIDADIECKKRSIMAHEELIEYVDKGEKEKYRKSLERHLSHIVDDVHRMREIYPDYFED